MGTANCFFLPEQKKNGRARAYHRDQEECACDDRRMREGGRERGRERREGVRERERGVLINGIEVLPLQIGECTDRTGADSHPFWFMSSVHRHAGVLDVRGLAHHAAPVRERHVDRVRRPHRDLLRAGRCPIKWTRRGRETGLLDNHSPLPYAGLCSTHELSQQFDSTLTQMSQIESSQIEYLSG